MCQHVCHLIDTAPVFSSRTHTHKTSGLLLVHRVDVLASGLHRDRPDVGENAAGVPGWEGSDERRGAVELDAVIAGGLSPRELAGVPFHEGFGFRRDVEVLLEAGVRLADLCVSVLDD